MVQYEHANGVLSPMTTTAPAGTERPTSNRRYKLAGATSARKTVAIGGRLRRTRTPGRTACHRTDTTGCRPGHEAQKGAYKEEKPNGAACKDEDRKYGWGEEIT